MYRHFGKRLCDLTIAIAAFPFWIIMLMILSPLIYLEDRGTVFYSAPRLGKDGRIFKMYKFRSMKMNAPDIRNEDGSTFNSENDPRLTKIGRIIRRTSLDETPQILNIIKGDMSVVGPRPDLPEDIYLYTEHQRKSLTVRPGVSGYSQAYFRNAASQEEKFNNDAYYAENVSMLFDMKIIARTVGAVLKKENIYKN